LRKADVAVPVYWALGALSGHLYGKRRLAGFSRGLPARCELSFTSFAYRVLAGCSGVAQQLRVLCATASDQSPVFCVSVAVAFPRKNTIFYF
jgi:hypothetical protein